MEVLSLLSKYASWGDEDALANVEGNSKPPVPKQSVPAESEATDTDEMVLDG